MLSASARELVRGRRPLWATTWLAAGLLCIPGVLYSSGGSMPSFGRHESCSLCSSCPGSAGSEPWVTTRRLLKTVLITCAVAALSATFLVLAMGRTADLIVGVYAISAMIMIVSMFVLLAVLARLVFDAQTYRSGLQAVLFLLGIFVLRLGDPARSTDAWNQVLAVCLCGLAVMWFTRAPRRGAKALACYFALFVSVLASLSTGITFGAIVFAAFTAGVYQAIVCSPLLPAMREEAELNRLRIAR